MIELKNSRTTYLGRASGGEKYALDAFIGAVQMREAGGQWQDIKPQLVRDADGWHVEGAPYYAEIKDDGTRLFCPDRSEKSKFVRLPSPVYFETLAKNPVNNPTKLDRTLLPNQITIPTDWGEYRIIFSNTGMHFEILFLKAPPDEVFGSNKKIQLDMEASGYDIAGLLKSKEGIGIPRPRLLADGQQPYDDISQTKWLDWSYKNGQLELGFDFGELGFPILLKNTTVDVQVGASTDDGTRASGTNDFVYTNAVDTLGHRDDAAYLSVHSFHRFTGVTINGTIDVAYLQCYRHATDTGTPNLKIYGVDEDNPNAPTSADEFDADPLTSTAVDWDSNWSGSWNDSPSIVSILQELVDVYTIDGDAIMFQIRNEASSGNNYHALRMWNYSGNTYGAKLHIEYTAGGATEKTAAETGSGAEGSALLAAVTRGETGGGAEAGLSLLAGLAGADSGSGQEQSLLSLLISTIDSGAGVEAVVASLAELMKSDSGSATEGVSGRGLVLPDSGNGSDITLALIAAIVAADTGGGIEQSVFSSIVAKIAAETGAGADAAEIIAGLIASETGLGSDAGVIVGLKQLLSGDGGISVKALKALISTSKTGLDMKLPGGAGRVRIPSRGVSL
jgi:hypothetical protein